jgi:hypothetical protein
MGRRQPLKPFSFLAALVFFAYTLEARVIGKASLLLLYYYYYYHIICVLLYTNFVGQQTLKSCSFCRPTDVSSDQILMFQVNDTLVKIIFIIKRCYYCMWKCFKNIHQA